jgi:cellulose synthase/poly-beta-1,6-N-acetylglucosamine synthase-like glycosyltransferase
MLLEIIWVTLFVLSVVPFGLYLAKMWRVAKRRPWNIKFDESYEPTISVVVATYEEESMIVKKLDNLAQVDYPKEKMELIIVDSASRDATVSLSEGWAKKHPELKMLIIQQKERKGLVNAIIEGLNNATGEVFIKSDADCMIYPDSIRKALKYLPDQQIGSVAGLHRIVSKKETSSVRTEKTYREFYGMLRIGESKLYGTVLYEGELMLAKRQLLAKIGFDETVGGDDVAIALRMALNGYRAITADDCFFVEQTPYTWKERINQKFRRARHVFQALWKYKFLINRENNVFHKLILPFETYIYVVNPFFVLLLTLTSIPFVFRYPWLLVFSLVLLIPRVRQMFVTFLSNNWIMFAAIAMEARSPEKMTWRKIEEIRETS